MAPYSIRAHFDGEQVRLDEQINLPVNTPLLITVITPELDAERQAWLKFSAAGLERAYGDDEPEYSLDDLRP